MSSSTSSNPDMTSSRTFKKDYGRSWSSQVDLVHDSTVIGAASQHVLHGMVPSGTTTGCVLRSLTCGSAQQGNSSIAQSVQPDGISGLSSKIHVLLSLSSQSASIIRTFQWQAELVQWPDHPSGHDSVGTVVRGQWVLTECRTPCSRSRSLGGSAPCSISSTSSCPGVWFPSCGNGALLCRSRHQLSPHLLRRAASNSSSIWPHWTAHLFPTRRLPGRIPMGC